MFFINYRLTLLTLTFILSKIMQRLFGNEEYHLPIERDLVYLLIVLMLTYIVFFIERRMLKFVKANKHSEEKI